MPQKVLSLVSTLLRCGPTSVLEGIVRGYDPAKYQATVATLSPEPRDSALEDFHSFGIPVEEMNLSRPGSFLFGVRLLRDMVQDLRIDLVHCHGFRPNVLLRKHRLDVPTVSTIHSDLLTNYKLVFGEVIGTRMAEYEYAALHRFDRVVAVSETAAKAVRSHGLQCEVITNGVDLNIYHPPVSPSEKALLRERLRLPLERTVVLHTGNLNNVKQPVEVVSGFRGSKLSKSAVLLVAGEGPLRRQCEQAAAGAKNILFLGKRQDMPDLLRASDVLVSNSRTEGLPLAMLEGCACGTHIIASDILPHRHIRDMFAQRVFLYSGHGPQAIAAALDAKGPWGVVHLQQPPWESLDAISALRMSRAYQRLYDDLCVRETHSGRSAVTQT